MCLRPGPQVRRSLAGRARRILPSARRGAPAWCLQVALGSVPAVRLSRKHARCPVSSLPFGVIIACLLRFGGPCPCACFPSSTCSFFLSLPLSFILFVYVFDGGSIRCDSMWVVCRWVAKACSSACVISEATRKHQKDENDEKAAEKRQRKGRIKQ
mgnify:CR=1 FL=1